ncbi:nucleoside transporter C-terminal domain-containing protein [Geitlerinema sp. PCC 9228]|jgi:CNT family concentrative nucleoside transporter|uniref:NupC/NupG family nucleoside CNT transporter n=1 Tax=Geitlerinema sp. PCC 9228 TaxID=111611 RepID=UPI0008F9AE7F|nr:nucleoside transporter C-terminal domain-containing protein [Geitlerinema sp. PCC 9228]
MHPLVNLISLLGIVFLCFVAWLGSENRSQIPWKVIVWGIGLQMAVGLLVFVLPTRDAIAQLNNLLNVILDASEAGSRFLFTDLFVPDPNEPPPGPGPAGRWIVRAVGVPYVAIPGDTLGADNIETGYILAFRALPQVIFFSALVALLYRLHIIQPVVRGFAWLFERTMRISGAESLSGAANIFVGIESAIAVKPFLLDMTRSELCAILSSCFGSIASSVLALYAGILRPTFPAITGHLVSASIMTIPACFVMAKLLVPETDTPKTLGHIPEEKSEDEAEEDEQESASQSKKQPNPIDSLILGALDGVKMAVGIAATIIAILGLVALVNAFFDGLAGMATSDNPIVNAIGNIFQQITIANLMGMLFLPFTFFTGVSIEWQELWQASTLIGRRLFETSIPPYLKLAELSRNGEISDRTMLIVSYVLCGFTHFASYGIFIGGLSGLIPSRRSEVASLGVKALWAGTLATLMTGCVAGLFDFGNPAVLGRP